MSRRITVWICDQCDYARLEKSSGVHMVQNPDDWRGPLIPHELRQAVFEEIESDGE